MKFTNVHLAMRHLISLGFNINDYSNGNNDDDFYCNTSRELSLMLIQFLSC